MDRVRFISKGLLASVFVLVAGAPSAEAKEDEEGFEGFSMSGGALLAGANGTQGA